MTPVKKSHEEVSTVEVSAVEKANGGISNVSILIISVFSLLLNVVCIYLLMGNSLSISSLHDPIGIKRALLEMEYQKVGGKENYELLAKAQLIQFNQTLPQLKEFIESQGGDVVDNAPVEPIVVRDASTIRATLKDGAVVEGNPDAKITVIEYSDMECPFCIKQYHDTKLKERLFAQYGDKINFVYKNNRGVNHQGTEPKSIGALCAGKVGGPVAYVQFYSAIMDMSPDGRNIFPVSRLPELASSIQGLDLEKWTACYNNKETKSQFEQETSEANKNKLGGTPGTLIRNNTTAKSDIVEGAYPYETFAEKIDALLK